MLYARDSRKFKCVQGICRLLGWPCDHSQRSSLLQTSKPPEKAADGNVPHVRRLQRFQNPYDDDAREHGTQVWSYRRTSEQPFCAQKSGVLRENNYPSGFIKECERALATKPSQPTTNGYVVLPYFKGVSERIGRVLKQQSLRVSFQPQRTINILFPRPKQQDETDRPSSGIVYRINCSQCDFVYYGQTERALKTRISKYKGCSDVRP